MSNEIESIKTQIEALENAREILFAQEIIFRQNKDFEPAVALWKASVKITGVMNELKARIEKANPSAARRALRTLKTQVRKFCRSFPEDRQPVNFEIEGHNDVSTTITVNFTSHEEALGMLSGLNFHYQLDLVEHQISWDDERTNFAFVFDIPSEYITTQ